MLSSRVTHWLGATWTMGKVGLPCRLHLESHPESRTCCNETKGHAPDRDPRPRDPDPGSYRAALLGAVGLGAGHEVCFHGNPHAVILRVGVCVCVCQVGEC